LVFETPTYFKRKTLRPRIDSNDTVKRAVCSFNESDIATDNNTEKNNDALEALLYVHLNDTGFMSLSASSDSSDDEEMSSPETKGCLSTTGRRQKPVFTGITPQNSSIYR
jgi:hypothetical protein